MTDIFYRVMNMTTAESNAPRCVNCHHPSAWHGRHGCYAISSAGACDCKLNAAASNLLHTLGEALRPRPEHVCDGGMNPPFPGPCLACEMEREK